MVYDPSVGGKLPSFAARVFLRFQNEMVSDSVLPSELFLVPKLLSNRPNFSTLGQIEKVFGGSRK